MGYKLYSIIMAFARDDMNGIIFDKIDDAMCVVYASANTGNHPMPAPPTKASFVINLDPIMLRETSCAGGYILHNSLKVFDIFSGVEGVCSEFKRNAVFSGDRKRD